MISHDDYFKLYAARSSVAKTLAIEALKGQLPPGIILSDQANQMYGNALFRIKPACVVKGSLSLHFFHGLYYKSMRAEDNSIVIIPTEERVSFSADIFNGRTWESFDEWGIDGTIKIVLFGKDDLVAAVHDVVSMMLAQKPFAKYEWKKDEYDAQKQHLFCGFRKMASIWKSGSLWGSTSGVMSETLGSAKVKAEAVAMASIAGEHRERLAKMDKNQSLSEERAVMFAEDTLSGLKFVGAVTPQKHQANSPAE